MREARRKKTAALALLVALLGCLSGSASAARSYLLEITPIFQYDYSGTLFTYEGEGKSVEEAGCGATCVSMVLHYFNPDLVQTPGTLLTWAMEEGLYVGNGLACQTLIQMLEQYGCSGAWVGAGDPLILRRAFKRGYPVIANMGPGIFTQNGHYIVLQGIDRNDNISVIDPNSKRRSESKYPFTTISEETAGTQAFLICYPPEEADKQAGG